MWTYDKRLQYPVKVMTPNPAMAKIILSQIGGPDGEAGAALRYLSQRYAAPDNTVRAILTDIGTEESEPTSRFLLIPFCGIQQSCTIIWKFFCNDCIQKLI